MGNEEAVEAALVGLTGLAGLEWDCAREPGVVSKAE